MIEYILRLDIIFFSIVLMIFVFIFLSAKNRGKNLQNRLFLLLTGSVTLMLFLEIPYILCNGKSQWAWLNWIINTLYHMIQSIPLVLYVLLVDSFLYNDRKRTKIILLKWLPFIGITFMLPLINIWVPVFFTIDAEGNYHRQFLLPLMFILQYIPIAVVLYTLLQKKNRLDTIVYLMMWVVPVPALLASLFQFLFPGFTLTWPFISLGIVALGLAFQHKKLTEDYLTGAYNRQSLDEYLHYKLRNCKPNKTFSAFLIDVDNFKSINDEFGHKTGDEALIESVRIFKSSVRNSDFVARYAGDEFVIVLDTTDQTNLENLASRIHQNADKFNASAGKFYNLTYSIGMGIFDPLQDNTIDNFIKRVDQDMYMVKRRKKTSQYMYDTKPNRR
ncbi:MAG: GGDEF domain-containing protein [Treponema sp.]|nr:GGDEF domain-containing protein [Treponema sp.]